MCDEGRLYFQRKFQNVQFNYRPKKSVFYLKITFLELRKL